MEALDGAKNSRMALINKVKELGQEKGKLLEKYVEAFKDELDSNLNMSGALALINEMLKSENSSEDKLATILDFDRVLGLNLNQAISEDSQEYKEGQNEELDSLLRQRIEAKSSKDYLKADALRKEIEELGFKVIDTSQGQIVSRN